MHPGLAKPQKSALNINAINKKKADTFTPEMKWRSRNTQAID